MGIVEKWATNKTLLILCSVKTGTGYFVCNVYKQVAVRHKTDFMRQLKSFMTFLLLMCFSCKKDSTQNNLTGQWVWTIQYADNPAYNTTPQSTGIQEILSFNENGNYSLAQNGTIINVGTYKLSTVKNNAGQNVSGIQYTNARVTDSVAYYMLANNNDSLFFTYDLIGTAGSGSRHYGKQ